MWKEAGMSLRKIPTSILKFGNVKFASFPTEVTLKKNLFDCCHKVFVLTPRLSAGDKRSEFFPTNFIYQNTPTCCVNLEKHLVALFFDFVFSTTTCWITVIQSPIASLHCVEPAEKPGLRFFP